jgi:tetratricopeptide (TPR) repeat protein
LSFISTAAFAQEDALNAALARVYKSYIPDSIIRYGDIAVELAQQNKKPELKAHALIYQARGYAGKGEYLKAQLALKEANEIISFMHIDTLQTDALLETGRLYQLQQEYKTAAEELVAGLELAKRIGSVTRTVKANIYLAEYYRHLAKFDKALHHISTAYRMSKGSSLPTPLLISLYNRYAAIKSETDQIDSSLYYSGLALELAKKSDNAHYIAVSLNEIGFAYEIKDDYTKSLPKYLEAERIWDSLGYVSNQVNVLGNHARVLNKMKRYAESNEVATKQIEIAEKQQWFEIMRDGYGLLYTNYYELKNYPKAISSLRMQNEATLNALRQVQEKQLQDQESKKLPGNDSVKINNTTNGTAGADINKEYQQANSLLKGIIIFLLIVIGLLLIKIYSDNKRQRHH